MPATNDNLPEPDDRPLFHVIVGPNPDTTAAMCALAVEQTVTTDPYTSIVHLDHLCPSGVGDILIAIGANAAADIATLAVLTNVFGGRDVTVTVVDEDGDNLIIDDPLNEFGYPALIWWLTATNSGMTSAIITLNHLTVGLNRAEHDDGNQESDHQFSIANTLPAVDALNEAGATFTLLPGVPVPDVLDAFGTEVAATWADAPSGMLLVGTFDGHDRHWAYTPSPLPATHTN